MVVPRAASVLSALVLPLLFASVTDAQLSAPTCDPGWEWASNSLNQNPCLVTAYLEGVCNGGQFSIPPLSPDHHYIGPNGPDNGDLCKCNTVAYSLISACDACQGSIWTEWSEWSANCTSVSSPGTFPEVIPSGTKVPGWAYLDVIQQDIWNNVTAFNNRSLAESTSTGGPTTINPSATTSSIPVTSATSSRSSTATSVPQNNSKSSSHAGAIAGGVVGGVVGVAAIGALIAWFIINRRRTRVPPSATYAGGPPPPMGQYDGVPTPFTPEPNATPKKYYDPSDPSTFPTSPSSPTIHTTNNTYSSIGVNGLQPNRNQYSGLPEV